MTVIDLVNRERGRLSRLIAATGGAAAIGCAALLLAAGVVALGRARWIDLPRVVPFIVWLAVVIVAVAGIWWTRRRLARDASVNGLAFEVEREQSLRAGALRGALEVASTGTLGRYNAEQVARRLNEKSGGKSLTPTLTRRALVRVGGAAAACGVGILLLATRSSATPDGWQAIAHPVRAWTGTLLAPISVQRAPKTVLRGERVALAISAPDRRRITVYQRAKGSAWRASQHEVRDGVAKVRLAPALSEDERAQLARTMATRVLAAAHALPVAVVCDLDGDTEQVIGRVVESAVKRSAAPESAIMVVVNTATDLDRGSSNFIRIRRA